MEIVGTATLEQMVLSWRYEGGLQLAIQAFI
jgi:hypothetical protein